MSDSIRLNDEQLQNVTGGADRTVNTGTAQPAAVRSGAGTHFPQIASLPGGTQVNTTGSVSSNGMDGITWFEINYPVYGWIPGSLIDF